jgi:arsenate reductase
MLAEIGLALPPHDSRALSMGDTRGAQIVVTMGCLTDASCPVHLKLRPVRDWGLPDPAELDDGGFRRVRDEIARRVAELIREIQRSNPPDPA